MTLRIQKVTVLAVLSLTLLAQASVAESENAVTTEQLSPNDRNGWILSQSYGEFDGTDAGDVPETQYVSSRIETLLDDNASVFFNCIVIDGNAEESKFQVGVNLDTTTEEFKRDIRWQHISGRLKVGERSKNYRWQWNPANMRITPVKEEPARRMFNGVIKGEKISLRTMGKDYLGQVLPAPDENFKAFYKNCTPLSGSD